MTYQRAALTHRAALVPLVVSVVVSAWSPRLGVMAYLLGVLLLMGILPRVKAFRRSVDLGRARLAAGLSRLALLERMLSAHRAELAILEGLTADVRARCQPGASRGSSGAELEDPAFERWLGLEKLVALYAELAVAYRAQVVAFPTEDRWALNTEGDYLNGRLAATDDPNGAWIERRREVLRRRQDAWQRADEERDRLVHSLATIAGVIRWMHEICMVPAGENVRLALEEALSSWESNGATLREVSSLRTAEGTAVDPRTFALGRDVLARSGAARPGESSGASESSARAPPEGLTPAAAAPLGSSATDVASTEPQRTIGFQRVEPSEHAVGPARLHLRPRMALKC